jgi:hypothetical protein
MIGRILRRTRKRRAILTQSNSSTGFHYSEPSEFL